ncbi:transcription antitermination factor NusB [Candidatus Roizmanbacteria bacterium]|nr:transcription antitermination factor NusB [Candidatus Roizmanbacteria bacterium]
MDPRHLQRIKIVQNLYAQSFNELNHNLPYPEEVKTGKIIAKLKTIDRYIKTYAPRYPIQNIAKTDLSILRLSIYELIYEKKTPKKVAIDEAVELAKEMSGEKAYAFINAVLGKILESHP